MDEQLLPDLLRLRGSVVAASDEFFAAKENLIKPTAPVFVPDTYGAKGQVYDGWETRRRRGPGGTLPERTARDWVIVRLGVPGVVRSIVVDTAFFTGNYPQACSADACSVSGYPSFEEIAGGPEAADWKEIVPRVLVTGDARHTFNVSSERRFTHIRLNIFPDGGVARLHVHGEVVPDPALFEGLTFDLAALENGADVAASSDQNSYSPPRNVISPGLSRVMGEGWETRRRRRACRRVAGHPAGRAGRHRPRGDRHLLVPGQPAGHRLTADTGRHYRRHDPRSVCLARPVAAGQAAAGHPAPVPGHRDAGHSRAAEHLPRRRRGPAATVRIADRRRRVGPTTPLG